MPLLEEERIKIDRQKKDALVNGLRKEADIGRSAERLSVNPDWLRIVEKFEKEIESRKSNKESIQDSIYRDAVTRDQKDIAVDQVRRMILEIEIFEFIIDYPNREMSAGREAEKKLKQMTE